MASPDTIQLRGVRVHNLKNIDVAIPRNAITVITGVSGSGKSSLAFDTIYAEGQRRYMESLSLYARSYFHQLERPDCDSISGLSPSIALAQKTRSENPRSTVGTMTEVLDYIRIAYVHSADLQCPHCGSCISTQSEEAIIKKINAYPPGTKLTFLAPLAVQRKGGFEKELKALQKAGYLRIEVDGQISGLDITLNKKIKHTISVLIDRLIVRGEDQTARIREGVHASLMLGKQMMLLRANQEEALLSLKSACCGISYPDPEPRLFSFNSPIGWCRICEGLGCDSCVYTRLRPESSSYVLAGRPIASVTELTIDEALDFFQLLPHPELFHDLFQTIINKLACMQQLGCGYLQLNRSADSLSSGESQRLRLATQLGSHLVGVTYILDEPSIGLHPNDHHRILKALADLRDAGNTVIIVEHDKDTMLAADTIIDMGPGAGTLGGDVIASGPLRAFMQENTVTARYLRGDYTIALQPKRPIDRMLKIKNINTHTLSNVAIQIPLGALTFITGVSGAGKSSLMDYVADALHTHLERKPHPGLSGCLDIDALLAIDQSPIGKNARSNPATYTGLFGFIRDYFAALPESCIRGFSASRFSANRSGGRCDTCEGLGVQKVSMHFLPEASIQCPTCLGKRYNPATLEVRIKNLSIADVLELSVDEARLIFEAIPLIRRRLDTLHDVGLGYLKLTQSRLSGGEAQRLKLARELSKKFAGHTLYILDEPTTGLHIQDIQKLVTILQKLVDHNNTVIVIEHAAEMIRSADYVIDLGPGGGIHGGKVIATGRPQDIRNNPASITGRYL